MNKRAILLALCFGLHSLPIFAADEDPPAGEHPGGDTPGTDRDPRISDRPDKGDIPDHGDHDGADHDGSDHDRGD